MPSQSRYQRAGLFLAALLPALLLPYWSASAATFTVNSAADVNDLTPGNGLCVAYLIVFPPFVLPFCTLRGAIEEANALPGPDRIILPAGTYNLGLAGMHEDNGASGDLDVTDSLVLSGAGADETVIDGNGLDRIFDLFGPATAVTISGTTLQNGSLPPGLTENEAGGAGIRNGAALSLHGVRLLANRVNGDAAADRGGGLLNIGSCVVVQSSVGGNRAAAGGGIASLAGATLEIRAATLSGNLAGTGGGLMNAGTGAMVNATISSNRAEGEVPATGGGIHNQGELEIIQSTVANNQATGPGGGVSNQGAASLSNTLIAGNSGGNCSPERVLSLGSNLDSDGTCLLDAAGDLSAVDPKLDPLGAHGGPTATHGLLLGSPAVDRGKDLRAMGITTDQRGIARPQGRGFDIGAFETGPRSLVPLLAPLLLPAK